MLSLTSHKRDADHGADDRSKTEESILVDTARAHDYITSIL